MNKILSKTKKHGSKTGLADLNQTTASIGTIDLGNRPILANQPITLNLPTQTQAAPTYGSSGGLFNIRSGTIGKSSSKDDKKKKKIDKSQISGPTGFKVVQHVGLSTNNSNFEIQLSNQDENSKKMREILAKLNMPINKRTIAIADDYIKANGGMERFDEELKKRAPVAPIASPVTPVIQHHQAPPPPPPPQQQPISSTPNQYRPGSNNVNQTVPPPRPPPAVMPQKPSVPPVPPPMPTSLPSSSANTVHPPPPPPPPVPPPMPPHLRQPPSQPKLPGN